MRDRGFDVLVGKRVRNIFINGSREHLVFVTDEGEYGFDAVGDCCSNSWFEHVENVPAIRDATVISVREINRGEVKADNDYDVIEAYGYMFTTDKGYFTIEMRNCSNGYYSGWVEAGRTTLTGHEKIRNDF